jgi:hypothetical protein
MNILFIGPKVKSRADIRSFGHMWAYYLPEALRAEGVDVDHRWKHHQDKDVDAWWHAIDFSAVGHVVAVSKYFDKVPRGAGGHAMTQCRGRVTHIHDVPTEGPVDLTFSLTPYTRGQPKNSHYIGWAADKELWKRRQRPDELRILVDHPLYGGRDTETPDIVENVLAFARELRRTTGRYQIVRVRRIIDGGVVDCIGSINRPAHYDREAVSVEVLAKEFGEADIFVTTHRESLGQQVLEACMCGALPVIKFNHLRPTLTAAMADKLRFVEYERGEIPWDTIMDRLDPLASRALAVQFSWQRVARAIIAKLEADGEKT